MDYHQALDFLYGLTDYEKAPAVVYSPERYSLERMSQLLARVGNPHLGRATVHIAGTKGKGSTAAMIAAVLSQAGYRTGLYTSPHLHSFCERIRVDGQLISPERVVSLVEELRPHVVAMNEEARSFPVTTFEVMTAMAFLHFCRSGVEIQVLETGLGGRLDATNVVTPTVSVITSISYDHTAILGSTLAQIATEKAGIIKRGRPVVNAPQEAEAAAVIAEVCAERGARLTQVGLDLVWRPERGSLQGAEDGPRGQSLVVVDSFGERTLWIPLLGEHQLENATVAVAALEVLRDQGIPWTEEALSQGLAQVSWPGRLEVLGVHPWLIVDGAHNVESARALATALREHFEFGRVVLIFGASSDKDVDEMAGELVALGPRVIATRSAHPRSAAAEAVAQAFATRGLSVEVISGVEAALRRAQALAEREDLIVATGSLFLVAEVRQAALGLDKVKAA